MSEKKPQSSKKKLFAVLDILNKYSDEEHPINANEIKEKLEKHYDIVAERKSIYRDIETLRECDVDIERASSTKDGYYMASRRFEMAEIRMIIDAILGAKSVSKKKTKDIMQKLKEELSIHQAEDIESQIYCDKRIKVGNEQLFYVIDTINRAISSNKKISFNYFHKVIKNNKIKKGEVKKFVVSPYSLIWNDDKYYLVCNYEKYDDLSHFRLDRMEKVEILDEPARYFGEVCEYKNAFDSGDYSTKAFQMYSGKEGEIELICDIDILEKMLDRFGMEATYINYGDNKFILRSSGYISEGLAGWLLQFSDKCYIKKPDILREDVLKMAKSIIECQGRF